MNKETIMLKKIKGSILFFLLIGSSILLSCLDQNFETEEERLAKIEEQFQFELDQIDSYIEQYIEENAETMPIDIDTLPEFEIRYEMKEEGTGDMPALTDSIRITYSGRLLSDDEFDSGTRTFKLNGLIGAWQIMMPNVKEGGTIEFYAPSFYCYGPQGSGPIPPNAPLIFEITLHEVIPVP